MFRYIDSEITLLITLIISSFVGLIYASWHSAEITAEEWNKRCPSAQVTARELWHGHDSIILDISNCKTDAQRR